MLKTFGNIKAFITKYANVFCILALILFCYLFLFQNLGAYRLIDIDETRYINIARAMLARGDLITPYLNFEPFLEKPPLYFWLVVLSYKLFGTINEFTSRFPLAVLMTFAVFFTYFFGKKTVGSKVYGLISALILVSSLWVLLFSHVAVLDIGFMVFVMSTVYCAVLTLFVKEKNQKYFWYMTYLFMALSVLQKGLIGLILPVLVIFFVFLANRKVKEIFKPVNILPGLLIFLLVAGPWHYLVYKANGMAWFNEYILKHHFARFVDSSMGLGRKQPFLFYIPIIIVGFLPWIFSFIAALFRGVKAIIKDFKATKSVKQLFSTDNNDRKILNFSAIYFAVVLLFFSISSTKLPTYILPLFPPMALLCGYYWWGYIADNKFARGIQISSLIGIVTFIIAGILGSLVVYLVPKTELIYAVESSSFRVLMCSWLIVLSLIGLLCLIAKNRALLFVSNVIMMVGVTLITTAYIFNYTTSFGQDELEFYASKADSITDSKLVSFGFGRKYSLLNNFQGKVIYITDAEPKDYAVLNTVLNNAKKNNQPVYLILKKSTPYDMERFDGFLPVESGRKYDLYVK